LCEIFYSTVLIHKSNINWQSIEHGIYFARSKTSSKEMPSICSKSEYNVPSIISRLLV
jgi:hypothetical protein